MPGHASSTPPLSKRHVPAFDGLRGVAILGVLLYHFAFSMAGRGAVDGTAKLLLRSGWIGVDLFFVLSGFLITGILVDAKGEAGYFRTFFVRRALRIFPLYFAAVSALVLGLHVVLPALTSHAAPPGEIWPFWTYLTNVAVAVKGDWSAVPNYGIHFWSLAVEEQFYLAWPLVVWFCAAPTLRRVCLGAIVGAAVLRIALFATGVAPVALYVLPVTRLDSLAGGALLALAVRDPLLGAHVRVWLRRLTPAAAALLAALAFWRGALENLDGATLAFALPLLAVLAGRVVLATFEGSGAGGAWDRVLCARPLQVLGRYSYGLYVIHFPLRAVFDKVGARYLAFEVFGSELPARVLYFALATGGSLALALVSWHLLERPFLRLKDRFSYGAPRTRAQRPALAGDAAPDALPS